MKKEQTAQDIIDSVDTSSEGFTDDDMTNVLTKMRNDENGLPI